MRTLKVVVLVKLLLLALAASSCTVPRVFIDIPAVSTPQREARYWRTQDAVNFAAGVGADQGLRYVFRGPTDHVGMRLWVDSAGVQHTATFRWRTGDNAPIYRMGTVILLGGIRRQTDRGYRESGWLLDTMGALANEWLHIVIAYARGRF